MTNKVIVKDKDGNIINEYKSINECSKDVKIYTDKIIYLSVNHILYNDRYFYLDYIPSNYIKTSCEYCGKEFYNNKRRINESKHIYCCDECRKNASKIKDNCVCPICGKSFYRDNWSLKQNKNNYCSIECANIAKSINMKGRPNKCNKVKFTEKDGLYYKNGHKYIQIDNKRLYSLESNTNKNLILEEIVIAEKYLLNKENQIIIDDNKYLSTEYVVAHKNFKLDDNRVDNLLIIKKEDYTNKLTTLITNYFEFKNYCEMQKLDYRETYSAYLSNKANYKYNSNEIGVW